MTSEKQKMMAGALYDPATPSSARTAGGRSV